MKHCPHARLKNLPGHVWCRDCGALRVLEEHGRWVRPGRVWRTSERTDRTVKKTKQQLTLPET